MVDKKRSPLARYYRGDRDDEARQAWSEERQRYLARPGNREAARVYALKRRGQPTGPERDALLEAFIDAIRKGATYSEALAETGLATPAITGRRGTDPDYAERLDAALMETRGPSAGGYQHGTLNGYTHGRCRCPECRDAKNEQRKRLT